MAEKGKAKDKTGEERLREQTAAMNQELMIAVVRQHELAEAAERLNAELQAEITERKRVEEELRKYRDSLEKLVEERTAELKSKNEQLLGEIAERERREGEALRMQKLESLRVLAGGI